MVGKMGSNLINAMPTQISQPAIAMAKSIKHAYHTVTKSHHSALMKKTHHRPTTHTVIDNMMQRITQLRNMATEGARKTKKHATFATQGVKRQVSHLGKKRKNHQLGHAQAQAHTVARQLPTTFDNYQPLQREQGDKEQTTQPNIVVNFNPTIHLGNTQQGNIKELVMQALQDGSHEFEQLLHRVMDQQQRRAY